MSARTGSTVSAASNTSAGSGASDYVLNDSNWPKVCRKTGKWYDCLRPVPGYQGFGGLSDFGSKGSAAGRKPSEEDWNWTPEIQGKMYNDKKDGKKPQVTSRYNY